jgi:hypothetical protein
MIFRIRASCCLLLSILLITLAVCWGQDTKIDFQSVVSLELKIMNNSTEIGTATGFVIDRNNRHYLVTNRHVVLACSPDPNPADLGGWLCANKISICHNRMGHLLESVWVTEDLLDEQGHKRWFEHPTLGGSVDIVAIPLEHTENVQFYPLDLALAKTDMVVLPGDSVSIIGFPLGLVQSAGLPIWKTGTVASDPDLNFRGRPMFAVDTTSRPGMSGSPVYAVRSSAYQSTSGQLKGIFSGGSAKKFLGVYSEQSQAVEIGGVWKAEVLKVLYDSLP